MSIVAFTGLPGHGKSYGVVAHVILPALKAGRQVVTNIPLEMDEILKTFPDAKIQFIEKIDEFADGTKTFERDVPPGAVVIIDEVWRIWPAGIRANEAPADHKTFLAEHRHLVGPDGLTTEVVLVTQDLAQISNFARLLVEKTFITHKMIQLGSKANYRVDIHHGAVVGQRGGSNSSGGSQHGKYSESVWKYYKSHTKSPNVVGIEAEADTRGSVWRRPIIWLGLPAGAAVVVFAVYFVADSFTSQGDEANPTATHSAKTESARDRQSRQTPRATRVVAEITPEAEIRQKTLREVVYDVWQGKSDLPLSERWRLGASLMPMSSQFELPGHETPTGLVLITDDKRTVTLSTRGCTVLKNSVMEYECVYEGERITTFSGSSGRSINQIGNVGGLGVFN